MKRCRGSAAESFHFTLHSANLGMSSRHNIDHHTPNQSIEHTLNKGGTYYVQCDTLPYQLKHICSLSHLRTTTPNYQILHYDQFKIMTEEKSCTQNDYNVYCRMYTNLNHTVECLDCAECLVLDALS